MGGNAFNSGPAPLHTPRMPPHIYHSTQAACHLALQKLYIYVASPIDGPAKTSFGDVDILVACPIPGFDVGPKEEAIGDALGAVRMMRAQGGESHFAIPWPSSSDRREPTGDFKSEDENAAQRYIQIDVSICNTMEFFSWHLFHHAHGDFWQIMGSLIRPLGLTVDQTALWLRIPEIEAFNRTRSRVHLTSEPGEVLSFLGLDFASRVWEEPFQSLEDMFWYISSFRYFSISKEAPSEGDVISKGEKENRNSGSGRGDGTWKSHDRRHLRTRPVFSTFFENFVPQCRTEGKFIRQETVHTVRERVRADAFARFTGVDEEYSRRLAAFRLEKQREHIYRVVIKGYFPNLPSVDPIYRGCLLKALKAIVLEGDESYEVVPERPFKEKDGSFIEDNVRAFVEMAHEEVGRIAMRRNHERYVENLKKKGEWKETVDKVSGDVEKEMEVPNPSIE